MSPVLNQRLPVASVKNSSCVLAGCLEDIRMAGCSISAVDLLVISLRHVPSSDVDLAPVTRFDCQYLALLYLPGAGLVRHLVVALLPVDQLEVHRLHRRPHRASAHLFETRDRATGARLCQAVALQKALCADTEDIL